MNNEQAKEMAKNLKAKMRSGSYEDHIDHIISSMTEYANQVADQRAKPLVEALQEALACMKWMWDNMRLEEGKEYLQSDAFNIPANAIEQAEKAFYSYKEGIDNSTTTQP